MKAIILILKENKVFFNAFTTVLQLVLTGVSYLLLYKILIFYVGVATIGVWAIVVATSSIANLAGLGVSSGLVKFVAEYNQSKQFHKIKELLFTASLITAVLYFVIALIVWAVSGYLLSKVIDTNYLIVANQLIPFSLLSLVFNGCSSVYISILDGLQKNYMKNVILIVSTLVYIILVFLLLKYNDGNIITVAKVQCFQGLLVLFSAAYLVYRLIRGHSANKASWNSQVFKQIFSYGIKFQVISLTQLFYEPLTKALLSKFAGVAVVGYYDMASRLVFQVRGLIVNANQVLVPKIASNQSNEAITDVYTKSLKYLLIIVLPLISGMIFLAIPISLVWIGSYQESFIYSVSFLSIALCINIISGPAYFTFVGLGKLNPLLISHILIGLVNLVAAYILTLFSKSYGVIIGWSLALLIGSSYVIHAFHKLSKTSFFSVLNKVQINTLTAGFIGLTFGLLINIFFRYFIGFRPEMLFVGFSLIFLSFIVLIIYINRRDIKTLVTAIRK